MKRLTCLPLTGHLQASLALRHALAVPFIAAVLALAAMVPGKAGAADWPVDPESYRVGNPFRTPFNPNDTRRNLFALAHANGYKYGGSSFNLSLLPVPGLNGRDPDEVQQVLGASWTLPLAARWAFEGYASVLASKLLDDARAEPFADSSLAIQLMYDASAAMGYRKNAFRIGIEYQYSNTKPGNAWGIANGLGGRTSTPALRAEYNFR